jgi:predicted DNA-binding protein (MmcQ/YjbR family)
MVFDISKVTGIGEFTVQKEKDRELYLKNSHVFLVLRANTIEVRCDLQLSRTLIEEYESVMESRYFGRGGIEIVLAGNQFTTSEIEDLVRLSYNLTKDEL